MGLDRRDGGYHGLDSPLHDRVLVGSEKTSCQTSVSE